MVPTCRIVMTRTTAASRAIRPTSFVTRAISSPEWVDV